jgi:hypothetical protein
VGTTAPGRTGTTPPPTCRRARSTVICEPAGGEHRHVALRTPRQAFAIGLLHGVAGTGAVIVVLIAALPSRLEAAAALAVFAPMTLISMTGLTGALAWLMTRRAVEPLYRAVLIPALGLSGLMFGLWYSGIG